MRQLVTRFRRHAKQLCLLVENLGQYSVTNLVVAPVAGRASVGRRGYACVRRGVWMLHSVMLYKECWTAIVPLVAGANWLEEEGEES